MLRLNEPLNSFSSSAEASPAIAKSEREIEREVIASLDSIGRLWQSRKETEREAVLAKEATVKTKEEHYYTPKSGLLKCICLFSQCISFFLSFFPPPKCEFVCVLLPSSL